MRNVIGIAVAFCLCLSFYWIVTDEGRQEHASVRIASTQWAL